MNKTLAKLLVPVSLLALIGLVLITGGRSVSAQTAEARLDHDLDGYCHPFALDNKCDGQAQPGDCDDADSKRYPGQPECDGHGLGDGIDNDCDEQAIVDNGCLDHDDDGDGYCEAEVCRDDGENPLPQPGDCDDAKSRVYPGAPESYERQVHRRSGGRIVARQHVLVLDQIDNDCDGVVDEGTIAFDDDGDGFCEKEPCLGGAKPGDCDDANTAVHPDAPEGETRDGALYGDGVDNDCDGAVDEDAVDVDNDGDGFCKAETCRDQARPGDCDDARPDVFPGAPELTANQPVKARLVITDSLDNDCDGIVDNHNEYFDDDGDGFCEKDHCLGQASAEGGSASGGKPGDCDDALVNVHPDAPEGEVRDGQVYGDGLDNDCDGIVDEGTRSFDTDGDGVAPKDGDCDDRHPLISGKTAEWLDGLDNDCDGIVDEDDGLAPLDSRPEVSDKDYPIFYDVYPMDVFEVRERSWAYEQEADIAAFDAVSGRLMLKKHDAPATQVLEEGGYKFDKIMPPYLVATSEEFAGDKVLLRFDERLFPLRVSLNLEESVYGMVQATFGPAFDGLALQNPRQTIELASSRKQVITSAITAWPTSSIFFWVCQTNPCEELHYLGQIALRDVEPHSVKVGQEVVVEVNTIDRHDIIACRDAYSRTDPGPKKKFEIAYFQVREACEPIVGQEELHFTLTFER